MNVRYLLLAGAMLSVSGCDQMQSTLNAPQSESAPAAVSSTVVATVNGEPITQEVLDVYTSQRAAKAGEQRIASGPSGSVPAADLVLVSSWSSIAVSSTR